MNKLMFMGLVISLALAGGLGYQYYDTWQALKVSRQEVVSYDLKLKEVEATLASTTAEKERIFAELTAEQIQTLDLAEERWSESTTR